MFQITQSVKIRAILFMIVSLLGLLLCLGLQQSVASAESPLPKGVPEFQVKPNEGVDVCGSGNQAVKMSIDIGCKGTGNPIFDGLYAILRFLSVGVGVILIGSMIVVGMQYSFSRGDPNATATAKNRMFYIFIALITYLLAYAGLNYLVPGGILIGG